MTSHRSGCRRGARTELELAANQPLHSEVILDDQDKIHAFDADLQAPASAGDGKERRGAPSVCGSAGGNASAVFSTKEESTFE
jgi:hypothetical protein